MSKATEELLDVLHGAVADELLSRIRSGDVDAATIAQARQFLKDNGISAEIGSSAKMRTLADELPDLPENVTPMYGG